MSNLEAYIVTLVFEDRRAFTEACVSVGPEAAAAAMALHAVQHMDPPPGQLVGVSVVELQPSFMRAALQAIKTGRSSGEVVSLAPREPEPDHTLGPAEPPPDMSPGRGHEWVRNLGGAMGCRKCYQPYATASRCCPADDADLRA